MKFFFSRVFPLVFYAAVIVFASSFNLKASPLTEGYNSYILHVLEFFILATLLLRCFFPMRFSFLLSFFIAVLFGYADEFHQLFVPGRTFSIYDFLADSLGAGLIIIYKNKHVRKLLLLPQ